MSEGVWYAPQGLQSGPGVSFAAFRRGLGYFEFGYDGWMEFALKGGAGDEALVDFDAEAVAVGRPRTDDRPVLIARVIDDTGEDGCWSVLRPGNRARVTLSCRLQGRPPWRLTLSSPASVEWGIRTPWLLRIHTIRAAAVPPASAAASPSG